ncbi:MAG: MotA/TolQ/ExbB proton channel family protein [Gemmatales bacterium]|nr:MotA/TolQ/ExbB proton channel family protein [Gemmatales bacterium]MDW8385967.1 MotA/TolQ/ExbB proton channel family protein [Gemmatales bacterium]
MSSASPKLSAASRIAQHVVVFAVAAGLTAALYVGLHLYADPSSLIVRYLAGHPVEYVETALFMWAMTALSVKAYQVASERWMLRRGLLPTWNGQPLPVERAAALLEQLEQAPRWMQNSLLGRRTRAALEFVLVRESAEGLDEHLRHLADNDAETAEGGYALVRFITWAIPILGFLGTVLGITEAIGNVTPEQLAGSISGVTAGLAVAFDTTALALVLSMAVMFTTFLVDRAEQGVLQAVDAYTEKELIHRFEHRDAASGEAVRIVRQGMSEVLHGMENLIRRQADIWAESLRVLQARLELAERQQADRLTAALNRALDQSLAAHEQRLTSVEQTWLTTLTTGMAPVERLASAVEQTREAVADQAARLNEHAALLRPLLESEQHILRLQETLAQNLTALNQSGAFLEAVHSLTAAIHLLMARAEGSANRPASASLLPRHRQGNAA